MAQNIVELDSEKFSCSICLDLLKDPVTLSCGHSYCMTCINGHWDSEDEKGIYSCSQCWKTCKRRPVLEKNVLLTEIVEELKKTTQQAAAGPEDVACDVCTKRKMKAVKSCLVCVASYCEKHLQPHYECPPLKKHKLAKPSEKLQENICSRHDKVMEIFCRTDQQLICHLCSVEEHKGHDIVSAAAERAERQRELEVRRQNIQERILDRERDVELLQQEVEAIKTSADETEEDSEKMFVKMIRLIQKRSYDVKQQIESQHQTEVGRFKELQEKLKQEITELKRKDDEMKQLLDTEDHNQFLHNYPSVSALGESTPSSSVNIHPRTCFDEVTAAVSNLQSELQGILRDGWANNPQRASQMEVLPPQPEPEPKTRAEFLKYSRNITLDPNTANTWLVLSDENRKVSFNKQQQSYPDHPDRFTGPFQVLSRESLTGRCYWEVELGGLGVYVAVAYKNASRASSECAFGCTTKSWALHCSRDSYVFWHKKTKTLLFSRIGVYLDHSAGILSFYSISETESMNLLHRVQTTFTRPLHAGLKFACYGSSVEFIKLI